MAKLEWVIWPSSQVLLKIEEILKEMRPNIQMDGGDIEFVSFNDGVVSVRLKGAV